MWPLCLSNFHTQSFVSETSERRRCYHIYMVKCPVCSRHVDYKYLRTEDPKDELGHDLGKWVHCENPSEKHVYLRNSGASSSSNKCPYCGSTEFSPMHEKQRVKCLHVTESGINCTARPYLWMEEGPPCFMNHTDKARLETAASS